MGENTASAKATEAEAGGKKPAASSRKTSTAKPSFNMEELRELAELVNDQGFTDFEFENENIRVRMSKLAAQELLQSAQSHEKGSSGQTTTTVSAVAETTAPQIESEEAIHKITSPIVGTFYRSAGPDKEPYVKEGSKVSADSVVCIVEAMKLMNEIQADVAGEVVTIYVENGQPVEFGQPLFGIRK